MAKEISDASPPAVREARVSNRNSLTTTNIPPSRFSELIEPLSFELGSATDNEGGSSLPPRDSDSDYRGPTICSPLAHWWLLSFTVIIVIFIITASPLKHHVILGRHLWKFPALLLTCFYGALFAHYANRFACSVAPTKGYVFYRPPEEFLTCVWIVLIYLTFAICVDESVLPSDVRDVVDGINQVLPPVFIACVIWQLKIMMFEMFRAAFHRKWFHERLKGAALDLYMLAALMGRESVERRRNVAGPMICIMKMANGMMAVALNTSRIHPRHEADRLLLESIEGFAKSGFKADHPSKILKAAQEVIERMSSGNGCIKKEDMENFLTNEEVDIAFSLMEDPYDVGKISELSFVEWMMIVEQINILDTVFLRLDHEKTKYPNSELLKKPISNCSWSPQMGEKIEFSIGISTPENSVSKLRERIKKYLESKPEYWQPKHSLFMTGIEDSKMKMNLNVLHRKSYRNFHEMNKRKSELLFELNTIFQDLGIENYAIPKETTSVRNEKDDSSVETTASTTPSIPVHLG